METRFILEASGPDGVEYRFEVNVNGMVLYLLSKLFGP